VGRETALEAMTTGIKIPPQLRCLHSAKAEMGKKLVIFSIRVTPGLLNSGLIIILTLNKINTIFS